MTRVLLTGAEGQLGLELQRWLAHGSELKAFGRRDLDIADFDAVRRALLAVRPDFLVNAAAYTAVDDAESNEEEAKRVNCDAVQVMSQECASLGIFLVHFSTDYVFDGAKIDRYTELDNPSPLSAYGRTKLSGEQALFGCPHLNFRTSWVFGIHGKNFYKTILRLATQRPQLRVVADQLGSPTWARTLAQAVSIVVRRDLDFLHRVSGTFHLSSHGDASWHEYARYVLELASSHPIFQTRLKAKADAVEAITSSEYPTVARRPLNSRLNVSKFEATFGIQLPDWRAEVSACVREYLDIQCTNP